jgi:hypothetical protein
MNTGAKGARIIEIRKQEQEVSKEPRMYGHLRQQLEGYGSGLFTAALSGSGAFLAWLSSLGPLLTFASTIGGGLIALVGIWLRHHFEMKKLRLLQNSELERLRKVLDAFEKSGGTLRGPRAALAIAADPPDMQAHIRERDRSVG